MNFWTFMDRNSTEVLLTVALLFIMAPLCCVGVAGELRKPCPTVVP